MAIEQTGATKSKMILVAAAMETQAIRKIEITTARHQLMIQLPLIAKEYGARYDLANNVIIEAIKIIFRKFSFLSIDEIREAYREWATGEVTVKGGQMWGGEFTVSQMAFVLAAYCTNRKKIAAELVKQKAAAAEAAAEAAAAKEANEAFNKTFLKRVEDARQRYYQWEQVPEFWFAVAWNRKLIKFEKGEAERIRAEAEEIAKRETAKEVREAKGFAAKVANRTKPAKSIGATSKEWINRNPDQEAKIKRIARKISVFRKLIEPFQEK